MGTEGFDVINVKQLYWKDNAQIPLMQAPPLLPNWQL